MTIAISVFIFAYLLGSIPFGLLLTAAAGLGDIRSIGSGNIGATNVLRTGNRKLAAATLLLDALKGVAAVVIVRHYASDLAPVAAIAALLGHLFPLWLKFRGGKGVATGMGVTLALLWPAGIGLLLIWAAVAWRSKISSLAALTAFGLLPLLVALCGRTDLLPLALCIAALIVFKHRANIRRLWLRSEPRIGDKALQ